MSRPTTSTTFGETPERVWLAECIQHGFPEVGDRIGADVNTIGAMCRAERKAAQVAIQLLAAEVRDRQNAQSADERSTLEFFRFALGAIFTVYGSVAIAEGWMKEPGVPTELQTAVKLYPEIIECADAMGPIEIT